MGRIRIARAVAGLIAAIALVSIAGAIGGRHGAAWVTGQTILLPARVWRGEVWRLVTWVLCEVDPLAFVLACVTLGWVGSELARAWGARRFVAVYFGLAATAGAAACLVGRLLRGGADDGAFAGGWPVLDGLIVAWGLLHPTRALLLFGIVRVSGRQIVWLTFGGTALYALFFGLEPFVPHFVAELAALAALGARGRLGGLRAAFERRRKAALAARARKFDLRDWIERDRRRR